MAGFPKIIRGALKRGASADSVFATENWRAKKCAHSVLPRSGAPKIRSQLEPSSSSLPRRLSWSSRLWAPQPHCCELQNSKDARREAQLSGLQAVPGDSTGLDAVGLHGRTCPGASGLRTRIEITRVLKIRPVRFITHLSLSAGANALPSPGATEAPVRWTAVQGARQQNLHPRFCLERPSLAT
jgi:hypothetical protein